MTVVAWVLSWLFSGFTALALALLAAPGGSVERQDTVQRTLRWSGSGARRLEASTINGSVRVVGYDGRDVELVARRTVRADTDAGIAEARERVRMAIEEGSEAIRVCADEERCGCDASRRNRRNLDRERERFHVHVDFELRVPRNAALIVCTVNEGDVEVEGMAAQFQVSNVNGAISLAFMRGSGSAVTVNGEVTAEFAESPSAASTFKTVNGDIEVRFPPDLSADLRLKTRNGGLYTDFEVTPRPADQAPEVEKRNGRRVYRTNQFATVRVGRGGPVLTFEGLNGDVRVLRATR